MNALKMVPVTDRFGGDHDQQEHPAAREDGGRRDRQDERVAWHFGVGTWSSFGIWGPKELKTHMNPNDVLL